MAECIFNKPEKTLDYIVIIVNVAKTEHTHPLRTA